MPAMPNCEWICELGPEKPAKGKKVMSRKDALIEVGKALTIVRQVVGRYPVLWHKPKTGTLSAIKILRKPGKPSVIRLRFNVEPYYITRLARKDERFQRLRPQHDYDK